MGTTSHPHPPGEHAHPNQFDLLKQRRFAPFFWVQFLGAGNDNVFKLAFTVMVTYQLQVVWLPAAMVKPFRRGVSSRVGLNLGAPDADAMVTPDCLRQRVLALTHS